jgi:hypothetical protein
MLIVECNPFACPFPELAASTPSPMFSPVPHPASITKQMTANPRPIALIPHESHANHPIAFPRHTNRVVKTM